MRILDVTPITDSSEMPLKKGSLQFLQDSYKEIVAAIVTALVSPGYNPSTVYVLYGCVNTGSLPVYNISAGVVFYNGEIFYVDAASFTATGSNVAIFSIITTQYTTDADPVTYTDSVIRNVHNIRKIQITQGVSGSTFADFSVAQYQLTAIPPQLQLTGTGQADVTGTYPNINVDVPVSGNLNPVVAAGEVNVGDVPSGGVTITVTFGTPLADANYYIMLTCQGSGGTPAHDCTTSFVVIRSTVANTGFQVRFQEWSAQGQALTLQYICFHQ